MKRLWGWKRLRARRKGVTEDEVVRCHHQLSGHEFEQTLGDGEGQGHLAGCSLWGHRVRHDWVTEQKQTWWRGLGSTLSSSAVISLIGQLDIVPLMCRSGVSTATARSGFVQEKDTGLRFQWLWLEITFQLFQSLRENSSDDHTDGMWRTHLSYEGWRGPSGTRLMAIPVLNEFCRWDVQRLC